MFTGLIETVGEVVGVTPAASGSRLRLRTGLAPALEPGDSLAVNGVCLTVARRDEAHVEADLGPETMRVTALGALAAGARVNLERSMRADARFGGHFVQGHVDATGVVADVRADGESHWIAIGYPAALEALLVPKGSIAVDGVSLTVAALHDRAEARAACEGGVFDVMIIPFTWEHTTLSSLRAGDRVNLECDMVGKYVARSLALAARSGLTT